MLLCSIRIMAEERGFEPLRDLHLLAVFETAPFGRLGIPLFAIVL